MTDHLDMEADTGAQAPQCISDDELTALALAADPNEPLSPDAVPLELYLASAASSLPAWYMAPVMARPTGSRLRQTVVLAVIGAFLVIEAFGLCSTFGQLPFFHR